MKRVRRILQNVFLTKTPIYVIFFVTSACNARCKMCFNWRNMENVPPAEDLKLDEIEKIFDNFGDIQHLTISGGEPFLRSDLAEILEFASRKNTVQMITIPTNGILPEKTFAETQRILEKIRPETHLRINLSVLGIGKKHDEITQVPGSFEKILRTYRMLRPLLGFYKNLNIDTSLCCSVFNKKSAKETLKYCNEHFKDCTVEITLARGNTRDRLSKDITAREYGEILDYYYRLKNARKENKPFAGIISSCDKIVNSQVLQIMKTKKMPSRCYAYSKMIVLESNGEVAPCEYLDTKLGNLRDYGYDIKKILAKEENKKVWKFIEDGKCYCTWECALINNIVCNPKIYPRVVGGLIRDRLAGHKTRPAPEGAVNYS